MIGIYLGGSSKYGCILSTARGTWNFARHLATLAQGSASEAHMNMEVNLCRFAGRKKGVHKILSAPCSSYVAFALEELHRYSN